jgi:hypothetical protein
MYIEYTRKQWQKWNRSLKNLLMCPDMYEPTDIVKFYVLDDS